MRTKWTELKVAVLLVVILAIGCFLAIAVNRPMRDAESKLLGTWNTKSGTTYVFGEDRTFSIDDGIQTGKWRVEDGMLIFSTRSESFNNDIAARLIATVYPSDWHSEKWKLTKVEDQSVVVTFNGGNKMTLLRAK